MSQTLDTGNQVLVTLTSEWSSGNASVHCTVHFQAQDLEAALALIKRATDGAPMFKTPEEGL